MRICILGSGMWLHLSRVATRGQACGYTSRVLSCTSLNSSLIVSYCPSIVYMFSVWACLFPSKHVFPRTYFALSSYIVHCAFSIMHLLLCISFCFPIGQVLPPVYYWPGRILKSLQSTDSLHSLLLSTCPCHLPPVHYWPGRILKSLQSTNSLPLFTSPFSVPSATSASLAWLDIRKPVEHWRPAASNFSFLSFAGCALVPSRPFISGCIMLYSRLSFLSCAILPSRFYSYRTLVFLGWI